MMIVSYLLFAATLATSIAAIVYTLSPALPRIIALLAGRDDSATMPHLVLRDRRQALRTRVAQPQTQPGRRAAA